jgi:hypothetical protein
MGNLFALQRSDSRYFDWTVETSKSGTSSLKEQNHEQTYFHHSGIARVLNCRGSVGMRSDTVSTSGLWYALVGRGGA